MLQCAGVGNRYDMAPDDITQMRQIASPLIVSISHQDEQYCQTPSNRVTEKRRANSLKQSHAGRPRRHTLTHLLQAYRQSARLDMTLSAQNVCANKQWPPNRLRGDHRYRLPLPRTRPPTPRTPAWPRRPANSRPVVDSDWPARDSNRNCAYEAPLRDIRCLASDYFGVSTVGSALLTQRRVKMMQLQAAFRSRWTT